MITAGATSASGQSPVANFSGSPLAGCSPLVVNFQDLSTGNPTSWNWDFGNGNTSALQNPTATYFVPGTYTISLTATNANGNNTLTRTQYITVYDIPTVNFMADNQSGCFPFRVNFTDLSTAGAGNTNVSWQWDFGDGGTSVLQNPSYTYTATGNYIVTLRVTNDKGCVKTISRPNYITVTPGVTAAFSHTQPIVCSAPADISFTNNSTGPGGLSWQWFFGDGSPVSALQNPVHTYTAPGNYNVTLVATSSAGCEDTVRTSVPITIGGITTSFTGPGSVCTNATAAFTNTSSPAPVSSFWTFGDGGTSNLINPTHIYTAPGTYTIRLYNTYANCTDSAISTITVNPLPVANFTAPVTTRCEPNLTVNFQDLSVGAVSWQWNFGDGNTSTLQNPSHTYTNYGSYSVTLFVTNAFGCTDVIIRSNFVTIRRAIINIPGLPARGCIPFLFTFNPNINALDAITSYLWTFGDGNTSVASNPTHTYAVQGTYTVKLVITTSTGCTDSITINNAIRVGSKPVADFSASPIPVCAYQPVQLTDLTVPADEWLWDFGDGNTSVLQNPSHTYVDTGYFPVTLIAANNGCADTISRPNYIQVLPPIARFISAANCSNRLQFTFTDQSVGATGWSWDFGDGSPASLLQNPVHIFPAFGSYTVTLTVTNGSCLHSVTHTIQTIDQNPDFTINASPICRGNPSTFTPAFASPGTISSLLWDFGNGIQVTTGVGPINYQYTASGTYSVTLISTDLNGCRDSITKNNIIRVNGPYANFNASANLSGCVGLTTTFIDLSLTDGVNPITSWFFDFGDGNTQTFSSPPFQHTYTATGTFSVKMRITDASGCADSLTRTNMITVTDPVPDFISGDTLSCPGAIVNFINTSSPSPASSFWDFGDGNTSALISPTHSYTATGIYTVKLIITDAFGCTDSVIKNNYIRVDQPDASFTVNDSIGSCTPLEVQFTNTSTYYTSSQWDFGPGEGTSTLINPVHFYSVPGTYRVRLIVTSAGGCTDSAFINITVNDTTGSRIDYTPISGCNPLPVTFNTVTSAIIESYFWDFGDGNTITTTSPTVPHTYSSFGNFVPKVIMLDPAGCLIPLTGIDTVKVVGANPDFGYTPALLCDSGYVSFSDSTTTSDAITSYNWTFGDGGISTLQNPSHNYTTPGIFDVSLTVGTQSGCFNTITIPAAVKVVLRPLIGITGDNDICINETILHSGIFLRPDTSLVTWAWTFPNGNTSTLQNPPIQTYNTAGNFTVTAISTNSSGCKDTATQDITVHPLPTATMPPQMTIQVGFPAQIPVTYSAGTDTWTWTPATGLSCTSCPAPDAGPRFNTTYQVLFSDDNGCSNRDTILVIVVCQNSNLFVPNTFSPNGDGSNDRFYPRGRGLYSIKTLRIFNRWGEIVFERHDFPVNNALSGWDGTYK
ncbi:MAG: PKD domain-containing protein, partial [Chitinophagaceae bacterium]|nr:PKD domain-containing protein [Chitinophagaceae bacterium]